MKKDAKNKKIILFVCSGNTCRSPMTAAIAQKILGDDYICISAGTLAIEGEFVNENAVNAIQEMDYGYVIKREVSPISEDLLGEADMVFCLGDNILEDLLDIFPEVKNKVFKYTLSRKAIPDPSDLYCFSDHEIKQLLALIMSDDENDLKSHIETYKLSADIIKDEFALNVQEKIVKKTQHPNSDSFKTKDFTRMDEGFVVEGKRG